MTKPVRRRQRRQRLTDRMVSELSRRPTAYFEPDPELPKHGIRIRPTGPGSYTVITRDPYKKQRWVKIGSTAEMTITEAREIARSVIKRVKQGLDPFEAAPVKPDSVADVVANWLKRYVEKNHLRTAAEIRRLVETHVLPPWAGREFASIKRSDIASLLDAIEDKHGAWTADATLTVLRQIASWFATRNDSYVPPFVKGMKRVAAQDRKRARILSESELQQVWRTAETAGTYGALVRLLLLTGQRREKVVSMKWSDISPDGVWEIPSAPREKNTAGALKLPEQALAIINALPRFASNEFVFAAARGNGPLSGFSKLKSDFDKSCGVSGWVVHDLRRTARSLMSKAGVPREHAERTLGHVIRGVEGTYDRHSYFEEKAHALRQLAALIERIVNPPGDNVVPMYPPEVAS